MTGIVSNIQKYTIHDGPGIRTEIFFKGCNLRCPWCSNPETARQTPELGVYPAKCVGADKCGWCLRDCPLGENTPVRFDGEGTLLPISMAASCADCLRCAESCPGGGITVWGRRYTVEELLKIIESDRSFYDRTGGGVTLNGGEVLLQWVFARELLRTCKAAGIGTCVESALCVPWEHVEAVLPWTDYFITDIKHMDPARHRALTGADNAAILGNIRRIAERGIPLVIRTPVVTGYNDEEENIRNTAAFIRDELAGRIVQYQLLPYRKMGTEKLATLGREYAMGDYEPPDRAEWESALLRLRDIAREYGVPAEAGSGSKWF